MSVVWTLVVWSLLAIFVPQNAESVKAAETILTSLDNSPIPFKLLRNKIIIPVRVNNSKELNIILDTGMPSDGLLLFDKNLADELKLAGAKRYRISGAGQGKVSYALRVESTLLTLSGNDFQDQRVLILERNTMRGYPTDGVIGHTLFGSHVIQINYDRKVITLIEPSEFKADTTWEEIPLTFNDHGIPFVDATVSISGEKEIDVYLYIDLASSEALELLVKPDMKYSLPEGLTEKHLGRGLDGILCDNALRRFNLIFDYGRAKLYIKPNATFNEPFALN